MIDCGVLIELLIDDIEEFVVCEDVDIVVEVMGLVELLCKVILGVFECGKFVVMVNKVLFVIFIGELVQVVESVYVDLYFEVVVVGVILVICLFIQLLVGDMVL